MKKVFTFLTFSLFACSLAQAQQGPDGKNLLKVNLTAIPLNNYSFQYERAVTNKISAAVGLRFMPESGLPFKSTVESLIDDEETWDQIKDLKTSNFAITPEVRFYMGQGVFRGFYVAPFVRFANYKADLPEFTFEVEVEDNNGNVIHTEDQDIPLNGSLNTFTGGVLLGAQWKLSKLVYLDWWILGPQYGTSKGDISGKRQLNDDEQRALREELEDLDIPLVDTESEVNSEGGRLNIKGPWAGVRAGLSLGFRF